MTEKLDIQQSNDMLDWMIALLKKKEELLRLEINEIQNEIDEIIEKKKWIEWLQDSQNQLSDAWATPKELSTIISNRCSELLGGDIVVNIQIILDMDLTELVRDLDNQVWCKLWFKKTVRGIHCRKEKRDSEYEKRLNKCDTLREIILEFSLEEVQDIWGVSAHAMKSFKERLNLKG